MFNPVPKMKRIRLSKNGYKKICELVDERDGSCVICGSTYGIHHHHIVFRSALGSDTLENLVCVCWKCHDRHCHGVEEKKWREHLKEYIQSLSDWKDTHKEIAEEIYKRNARCKNK